jgi:mRNA interferase MazF
MVKQYQVALVNLDPTVGSEINKTRPCVVISPDDLNDNMHTIVIAPMTTNLKKYPSRVAVMTGNKLGMVALDQIKTIDKSRIIKNFNSLNQFEIDEIKLVIKKLFVD